MSFLFGGPAPTTNELVRRYKGQIDKAVRELDRESAKLVYEDRILMQEIKRCAKTNPAMATQKAQAVVRTRKMNARFSKMRSHLNDVASRITGVKSTEALKKALTSVVSTMASFNAKAGNESLQKQLSEFARQNSAMGINVEMMEETLEDAFDVDENEEEVGNVVLDIMTEAGVTLPDVYVKRTEPAAVDDGRLEERLNRLRPPPAR